MPKYHPNINISGQINRFSVISRQMCLIPRAILQDNRANMPNTNKLALLAASVMFSPFLY